MTMSSIRTTTSRPGILLMLLPLLLPCMLVIVVPFVTGTLFSSIGQHPRRHAFQRRMIRHTMSPLLLQEEGFILLRGGDSSSSSNTINVNDDDEEEEDDDEEEVEEAVAITSSSDDDEEDEEDEDETEEEIVEKKSVTATKVDKKLATAALKSVTKTKEKIVQHQTAILKQAVQSKLSNSTPPSSKSKKNKGSVLQVYKRVVPYIIRAAMNPFTLIAMTKSYWASLFNLNYLHQQQQNGGGSNVLLRTAMEENEKRKVSLPSSSSSNRRSTKKTMKRGQAKTLNDLPKLSS